jgi:hypothetical protein
MTRKSVRRLLWTLAVLAALLVAGMIVAILSFGRAGSPAELPNPNGYNDLLKAAQTVRGRLDDASEIDTVGLHALVATNAEALRLLRVGLAKRCAVPTDALIANFATASSDLMGFKALARLLSAEGRLAELEHRRADAARSYVDAIRLGSEMSRGGLMMNRLVGIACQMIGAIPLKRLLPELTCEELRPLCAELERVDAGNVSWREVLQNENRFERAQMGSIANPLQLVSQLWQVRKVRKASAERHELAAAHLRLLIVELALRSYRCDHGSQPEKLTQLVPEYLKRIPADPFTGNPLVYHPTGTNWVLYSFGPDRVDDGGSLVGQSRESLPIGLGDNGSAEQPPRGDLLFDSPW